MLNSHSTDEEWCRYSAAIGPRVIDWRTPGCDPWDNPVARQASPGQGYFTGEEQAAATYDPRAFKPGDTPFPGDVMPGMPDALSEDSTGTIIAVDVTAHAKADLFPSGFNEWRQAIGCRVTAPPSEGRANKEVIALVAKTLGVPASSVSIVSGMTASHKRIHVFGLSKSALLRVLQSH